MSAFVNFEVDCLKKMIKDIQKRRFRMSLSPYILHTLRVLYDRETLVEPCYISEKAYNCTAREL